MQGKQSKKFYIMENLKNITNETEKKSMGDLIVISNEMEKKLMGDLIVISNEMEKKLVIYCIAKNSENPTIENIYKDLKLIDELLYQQMEKMLFNK